MGQDFHKHQYKALVMKEVLEEIPRPEAVVEVEHSGDVVSGGVHLFEVHLNTVISGGGLILFIIMTGILTYCCMHGILQNFSLQTCRVCCARGEGPGEEGAELLGVPMGERACRRECLLPHLSFAHLNRT